MISEHAYPYARKTDLHLQGVEVKEDLVASHIVASVCCQPNFSTQSTSPNVILHSRIPNVYEMEKITTILVCSFICSG